MSLPEEHCSNSPTDKVVVQDIAQLSILDNETVVGVENVGTISHACPGVRTNEDGVAGNGDNVNCSKELDEYSNDMNSDIINDSNAASEMDVNMIMSQSPSKKNRRKKKINVSDDDLTNDGKVVQNCLSSNTDPMSNMEFSIQHLNEVFSVWGPTKSKSDVKCQSSKDTACSTDCKQVKSDKEGKEENVNNVGIKECVGQGHNDVRIKCIVESATTQICESSSSHTLAVPGKSKSAEKKKKMKKLAKETKDKKLESVCQESARTPELQNTVSSSGSVTVATNIGSKVEASRRPKSTNASKKKSLCEGGSNVKPIDVASLDLAKNVNSGYQLLNSRGAKDVTGSKFQNSSIETPGGSQSPNEHREDKGHEGGNTIKSQRKVSQELGKIDKIAKKIMKKREGGAESENKNKRKARSKNKKVVVNASSDVLDTSETSPPQQKSPKLNSKKKDHNFEEYWTPSAVQEGLQNGTVIEGVIRINPKRFTEAYVTSPTGGQDLFVDGLVDRNRALEGDLVALLLKDPSDWIVKNQRREKKNSKADAETSETNESAAAEEEEEEILIEDSSYTENDPAKKTQVTAKVIAILSQQHPRTCVGYLKLNKKPSDKNALFSPRDTRVPRMQIPRHKCPQDFWVNPATKENTLYLGKIVKWNSGSFALGEIIKAIGETADLSAETEALLLDNDLDVTPYSEEFSKLYSSYTLDVGEEELGRREDLRKECIFTIDPETAKDLDDAVSCKELENGNLEIGVHISDVTHFLEENSNLDTIVSKRGTSVYLVDRVHHMLPEELCLLCSLLPGEDKFSYSVLWEISKDDAKVVSHRIVRSVINSCVKLAYEHAQALLENPDKEWDENEFPAISNGFSLSDISKVVYNLQMIAKKLRSQRFEGGALRIDQTKLFLQLDSNSKMPIAVHEYINKESHRLIEEFMLLANMTTAKFVYDKFPDIAFLRSHPEPHKWPLEQLQESMASRGIHLNITSAGTLQSSLQRYSGSDYLSQTRNMVLNALCAKTMTRAKYFCSGDVPQDEFWHYALNVPFYTHFTSPIRRYADVMVHRLLNAALGLCPRPLWSESHVSEIAANCNKKKYSAKTAGEQSMKLYLTIYLKSHQPVVEDAVVIDVKDHSFDVIICKYGLTMRVYTSKLDVNLENDPLQKSSPMKIIWKSDDEHPQPTLQVIDIFTLVRVKILCEQSLKLEAKLIRPADPENLTSESEET